MKRTLIAALALAIVPSSFAQMVFQTSFEVGEGYNVGNLSGQQGWTGGAGATVSTENARTGSQSVRVGTTGWWWNEFNYDTAGGPPLVHIGWSMFVPTVSDGRLFGIDIYTPAVVRLAAVRVINTGEVQFVHFPGNVSTLVNTGFFVTRGQWNDYQIQMDWNTFQFTASVNGTPVGVTGDFRNDAGTVIGDADIQSALGTSDVAYFDDYYVEAVPEPASLAALGLGALALLRRRRAAK